MAFNVLDIRQPLNTPFRVQRALEASQGAAWLLAAYNGFTALLTYYRPMHVRPWLPIAPHQLWLMHIAVALWAAALAMVLRRSSPSWAVWAVFVWMAVEAMPGVTAHLYGHGMPGPLLVFGAYLSVLGLRAVHARRKLATGDLQPS